jgi:uncharacterized membrane protein YagU involved in acid resistance
MPDNETKSDLPTHIDLPAPTMWPMVTAFGLALMAAGLVTNLAVSLVGFVAALSGAIGWWRDVLPSEKHERVPLVPQAERAAPVQPASAAVEYLKLGEKGHRVRVPAEIHPYSSGIKAGLAGGAVMALLAVLYGLVKHGSVWYPVNLLAAAGVSSLANATTEQLRAFSGLGFGVALFSHVVLSVLIGLVYAVMVPMFPRRGWLWAGIVTPLFWTGLFHATARFINPTLEGRVDWPWFVVCQVAFGLVTGYIVARSERIETRQTWPLAARVGLEAPEKE